MFMPGSNFVVSSVPYLPDYHEYSRNQTQNDNLVVKDTSDYSMTYGYESANTLKTNRLYCHESCEKWFHQ